MTHEPKTLIVVDPRTFDGDPFEVAELATRQAEAVARILVGTVETANIMARNAEMERNLIDSGDARAAEWEESLHGKRFTALAESVREAEKQLGVLAKAAGFNPKKAR